MGRGYQALDQNRFFGGFASFARPLSSRVVCVVVYGKVPWLSLHAKYRTCKAKQAAAPFFSRSQHTHNKRKEKPATQRASSQVLFPFFTSKKLRVSIPRHFLVLFSLYALYCRKGVKELIIINNNKDKTITMAEQFWIRERTRFMCVPCDKFK